MIQSCRRPNESQLRSAPGFRSRGDPSLGNCGNELREWAANRCVKAPPGLVNSGGAITYLSAPGRIRTCDLMLRRHALYPTELRARDFPRGPGKLVVAPLHW